MKGNLINAKEVCKEDCLPEPWKIVFLVLFLSLPMPLNSVDLSSVMSWNPSLSKHISWMGRNHTIGLRRKKFSGHKQASFTVQVHYQRNPLFENRFSYRNSMYILCILYPLKYLLIYFKYLSNMASKRSMDWLERIIWISSARRWALTINQLIPGNPNIFERVMPNPTFRTLLKPTQIRK